MTDAPRDERSSYLWDRSGPRDLELARLERDLAPFALRRRELDMAAPASVARRPRGIRWRFAAAGVAGLGLALFAWSAWRTAASGWPVERLAGEAEIDGRALAGAATLREGGRLTTGPRGRARLAIGVYGEMEVGATSSLRLVAASPDEHRVELQQGRIHARIWAPPGLVAVDTAAATAVDLGCTYVLAVDARGDGELAVETGWVALAHAGLESFVPAGASARIDRARGPGLPLWRDAPPTLAVAAHALELELAPADRALALEQALAAARPRDALTIWHLLARSRPEERAAIHDRLAALAQPPAGVEREGILAGDRAMLDAWWNALGLRTARWWRVWRQAWPPAAP